MKPIDLGYIRELYREFAGELAAVGKAQREFAESLKGTMTPQLDDLEAEITYLLLRATRPAAVMELGTFHGWSTSWILSALRDNGEGTLHSFDIIDNVVRNVPRDLAEGRWTFVKGDIKQTLDQVPADTGYLFVDAAHNAPFARWYLQHLFPRVPSDIPVSVHDVYHFRATLPFHEGKVVVRWLDERGVPFFTPSRAKAKADYAALNALRDELGLEPIRGAGNNPMIFFRMPALP
ncbi:class I SAM-dependent methyltransferase [Pseudonocardia nigra]|uniref:class I SAM-dependent methyltransferase n=1 Tax=Pseudonocardia nigra TaxID=1921578 RepID=UPI001C5DD7DC|nr:class I SAM-dependent methyltransferase [Pseudonocardia nigra]